MTNGTMEDRFESFVSDQRNRSWCSECNGSPFENLLTGFVRSECDTVRKEDSGFLLELFCLLDARTDPTGLVEQSVGRRLGLEPSVHITGNNEKK